MHQRKVIRDAAVTALLNHTPAGSKVKSTRVDPYRASELPAIAVHTPSDAIDEANTTSQELSRDLVLEVVAWVVDSDANPAEDQMDAMAESVEAAMDSDRYLGGACGRDGLVLQSTEMAIASEMDGRRFEQPRGVLRLTYTAPYLTSRVAQGALADFSTAATTTAINGLPVDTADPPVDNAIRDVIAIPT